MNISNINNHLNFKHRNIRFFRSPNDLEKFKNHLNFKHRNIRLTCKKEQNNSMAFLDVLITRNSNGFKTSVYHIPTFNGVYPNFKSFISEEHIKLF